MRRIAPYLVVGSTALTPFVAAGCQEPVVRERIVYREPPPPLPPPPPSIDRPAAEATAATADADFFHDDLAPYGEWVEVDEYGPVWLPANVAPGWRPYTLGQWAYTTDYGWTWVSDEPWGWATYHYGRWAFVERRGWCWVPGRVWGPGWVAWRSGGGYIGWAPLPPRRVGGRLSVDLDVSDVEMRGIRPDRFCFVAERFIVEPHVFEHVFPVARNVTIVNVTKNVTKYERVDGRIVNRSVNVEHVERATGRPVTRYAITESKSARATEIHGNEIAIHRPVIPEHGPAARSAGARSVPPERRSEDERGVRARAEMDERHRRELEAAPAERRSEIEARHERERGAFEEARQGEGAARSHSRVEPRER